ncbi:MAG: hypothetical protein ABSB22_25125 [Thermodesulfobacteriota bacterium]|jgi:hypothetical protein
MIERAIENWLINTNERNYHAPFCQALLSKGHRIIYVSSHRPMEQGKDIITIDKDGECCAYQLKTGDIDLKKWREISGEVKELIELPVVHPSADKSKIHKSFLVTNGEITDEVRIQIDQINEDNKRKDRRYSYLDVIHGKALLKEFIDAQGEFIPKDLEDFDLFLKLFLADGTDFLPKDKYFEFLDKTIFGDAPRQKANAINAISSSVILAAYSLNPYQLKNNYYALFEGWTCLAGSIVRYANKSNFEKGDWLDSYKLVFDEIIRNLSMLKEEMLQREDFLEGDWRGDGGLIYRVRATIVLGALATLMTHVHHAGKKPENDEKLISLMKKSLPVLCFWGESAFPYFFGIIKYLETKGEGSSAQSVLTNIFLEIINLNFPRKENGIPNVYYSASEIFEVIMKMDSRDIDLRGFAGNSYIIEAMILMMTRRNQRKILEENWRKITYVQMNEFMPDHPEDMFAWRTKDGTNHSEFPKITQSWAELQKEAINFDGAPQLLAERLDLLRFFILTCPHRATKLVTGLLDGSATP